MSSREQGIAPMSTDGKIPVHVKQLLIVDPDDRFAVILKTALGTAYSLDHVSNIDDGIARLKQNDVDVALLNWDWPKSGPPMSLKCQEFLDEAGSVTAQIPVLVFTWDRRRECAMEIVRQGAFDVFLQPLDVLELKFALDRAYVRTTLHRDLSAARALAPFSHVAGMIGNSKNMQRIYELVTKVAAVFTTVLIRGESGTGKELVARAIHRMSPRVDKPFMAFSPSALAETLIEAELFGHEKGAFTGAAQARRGRFEEAHGGTLFLDEIGELSPRAQTKLLRVLQEGELTRVGGSRAIQVDVRVLAATNRDLAGAVHAGAFREDLYFRLAVIPIRVPALRERAEDIPILVEHFVSQIANQTAQKVRTFTPAALDLLRGYEFPGNVRELRNIVERLLIMNPAGSIGPEHTRAVLPPSDLASPAAVGFPGTARRRGYRSRVRGQ